MVDESVDATDVTSASDGRSGGPRPPLRGTLPIAVLAKFLFLATVNALSLWAFIQLVPEGAWLAVAFLVITFLHVVYGELAPKSLALVMPDVPDVRHVLAQW